MVSLALRLKLNNVIKFATKRATKEARTTYNVYSRQMFLLLRICQRISESTCLPEFSQTTLGCWQCKFKSESTLPITDIAKEKLFTQ